MAWTGTATYQLCDCGQSSERLWASVALVLNEDKNSLSFSVVIRVKWINIYKALRRLSWSQKCYISICNYINQQIIHRGMKSIVLKQFSSREGGTGNLSLSCPSQPMSDITNPGRPVLTLPSPGHSLQGIHKQPLIFRLKMKTCWPTLVQTLQWTWNGDSGWTGCERAAALVRATPIEARSEKLKEDRWLQHSLQNLSISPNWNSSARLGHGFLALINWVLREQWSIVPLKANQWETLIHWKRGVGACLLHTWTVWTWDPPDHKWASSYPPSCLRQAFT